MDKINEQICKYESALQSAKNIENDLSWVKQYENRIEQLNQINIYLKNNDIENLKKIIEVESRDYGWSFYPEEHGEKANNAFWQLKKVLIESKKI